MNRLGPQETMRYGFGYGDNVIKFTKLFGVYWNSLVAVSLQLFKYGMPTTTKCGHMRNVKFGRTSDDRLRHLEGYVRLEMLLGWSRIRSPGDVDEQTIQKAEKHPNT